MNKPYINDIPNINNKLRCKNVHWDKTINRYVVQKWHKHIAVFTDFETAKKVAEIMNSFDMKDIGDIDKFKAYLKGVLQNERN